ncbi:hypothetical protein ABZ078_41060 [Streptomyces sp. NPDC006385]|uniref:sterol desaturase family protein n=1 Tax=Streptomyces sp. NPDC006385 TaxID=3156761 RepID=UPI0033A7532F
MAVAAALALAVAVQLLLQHSNADYRVGALRYVPSLNEGHRSHHLKRGGVGDVNFGLFTLVWDRLLGTYSFDPDRRFSTDDLGIAANPLTRPVTWHSSRSRSVLAAPAPPAPPLLRTAARTMGQRHKEPWRVRRAFRRTPNHCLRSRWCTRALGGQRTSQCPLREAVSRGRRGIRPCRGPWRRRRGRSWGAGRPRRSSGGTRG